MYLFLIARRYLFARWIMSGAGILAVLFAVFVLVVVRSVFEGFGEQMRDMLRGTTSHLVVTTVEPANLPYADEIADAARALPHVVGAAPYVETMAIYQTQSPRGSYLDYVQVRGIDPEREAEVGNLPYYLLRPEDLLRMVEHPDSPIGRAMDRTPLSPEEIEGLFGTERRDQLWARYREFYGRGDPALAEALAQKLPPPVIVGIQALMPPAPLIRFGSLLTLTTYAPRGNQIKTKDFLVVGAFHTGLFDVDLRTIFMPIGAAREFCDLYDPELPDEDGFPAGGYRDSGVGLALDDYDAHKAAVERALSLGVLSPFRERVLKANVSAQPFSPYTSTWEQRKRNLLRAVQIEKGIVSLIIGILVVFVGAIIFLILTLNVMEKRRDIGIIKAVGGHADSVLTIFLMHGLTICAVGLVLGFLVGLAFCHNINDIHDTITAYTGWRLFPPDVYYMDRIPVAIEPSDLATITGLTVLFGFLGSLVPAWLAARQDPIAAIRFE